MNCFNNFDYSSLYDYPNQMATPPADNIFNTQYIPYQGQNTKAMPATNPMSIVEPAEALRRGNLFTNLYQPYLAQEPFPVKVSNDREQMLNNVRELGFAAHELNLYLDDFPDDQNAIQLFNQYKQLSDQLTVDYERQYGPLTVNSDALDTYPWAWIQNPWPWDNR